MKTRRKIAGNWKSLKNLTMFTTLALLMVVLQIEEKSRNQTSSKDGLIKL